MFILTVAWFIHNNVLADMTLAKFDHAEQGWGTCSPWARCVLRKHLVRPTPEFLFPEI